MKKREPLPTHDSFATTKTVVEYNRNEKQISGRDLTDSNNLPAFYTKSKRGLEAAWTKLKADSSANFSLSMRDVMNSLQSDGIKTHYWCMMD